MDKVTDVDNSGMVSDSAYVSVSSEGEVSQEDAAETNVKEANSSVPAVEQMRSRVNETGLEARNAVISEVVDKIVDQKLDQKLDQRLEQRLNEVLRGMQLISAKADKAEKDIEGIRQEQGVMNQRQCGFDARLSDCDRIAKCALSCAM